MTETLEGAPAADPPGDTIYICPACGTRYDEPGECVNGHGATETVPYVKAEVQAFDQAQAAAAAATAAGEAPPTDFAWPEPAGGAVVPSNAGADPHALSEAGLSIPPPVPAEQVSTSVPAAPAPVAEAVPAVEATAQAGQDAQPAEDQLADLSQPVAPPAAEVAADASSSSSSTPATVDLATVAQAFADLEANIASMLATLKAHLGV